MIKKKIKEVLNYIFLDDENLSLEKRFFLSAITFGISICLIGFVIIYFIEETFTLLYIIVTILTILLLIIFYFVRFKRIFKPFVIPFIVVCFIGFAAGWILGGGMNGSNIMLGLVVLILALIIVSDNIRKYVISAFILLLIIIYLIQRYRPDFVVNFSSETNRWNDSISTAIYSSFLIYMIIKFLLAQYNIERKRAEENEIKLIQLNADKDRFISILSHDLKSPFNTLLGLSELLTEDIRKLDINEIEEIANNINKSSRNTYNLLEDILIWARAQQGNIPFLPKELIFINICKDTVEVLKQNATAKNITINILVDEELKVFADIDMLKTVMRNLVSNALKFTNRNGVIDIIAQENSTEITISVTDNGIGITQENLKKLFNISQVLSTTGTEEEKGTGLGLLLCREFVEKHGGKIWAESEYGKGSKFRFTIPVFKEKSS
jgi:signal transduction histidine kinase